MGSTELGTVYVIASNIADFTKGQWHAWDMKLSGTNSLFLRLLHLITITIVSCGSLENSNTSVRSCKQQHFCTRLS